jgi:predicted transcriptional regulator of viral defense system
MWVKTFASQVLRGFAEERRRVFSDWRILIQARRLAHAENAPLPDFQKADAIRKELVQRGDIAGFKGVEGVYFASVPYANLLEISEEQIIQEAHPWCVFGFLTALVFHGLTDLLPKEIYVIHFKDLSQPQRLPLGTTPEDWAELDLPSPRMAQKVGETKVNWTETQKKREFGVTIGYSSGLPIYVTDVERTLLDTLKSPEKSGGIAKVLQAWRNADGMDVDRLIKYTDQFDNQILRQRVGYLLEKLGHPHAQLEAWRGRLQRGGSIKLVASEPYSETYSVEWNLSLNVPPSVLAIIE